MPTYDEINNFPGGGQYRGVDERNEWRGEKGMIVYLEGEMCNDAVWIRLGWVDAAGLMRRLK
jgi:hypothetical protein